MANNFGNYPKNYLLFNSQTSKNLALVLEIEDVPDLFGISDTFTTVRYGDPNIVYGLPGLVYGGLRKVNFVKAYIQLDSSLVIQQRIEPESGKGNIGTITLTMIDKNGEISKLITPGIVVDEILFQKQVKLWLGFAQTSYPLDYLLIYQGFFTQVSCPPGKVSFQISDSTAKKRQPICDQPTTVLSAAIDNATFVIPIISTQDFYLSIVDGAGNADGKVALFIRVDDEIMSYENSGVAPDQITVTGRGLLGSLAVAHDIAAQVSNAVQLGDLVTGINCIETALKIQLSGWNGPCDSGIPLLSIVYAFTAGFQSNAFVLNNQDAVLDWGLSIGDYITLSGATNPGNNISGTIIGFGDFAYSNQIIYTNQTFILENPTTATLAIRSQYDTLPVGVGVKMKMRDVDVSTYLYIKNTYFTAAGTSNLSLYLDEAILGKDLIDTQIMLPFGCYSISRFGRSSMSITKPPLPGVGKLVQIDYTNVLDPDKITVTRSTNSRSFYNLITFSFDKDAVSGNYGFTTQFLDTDSLTRFDQVSTLPINADGLRATLGGAEIAAQRSRALLTRYKTCTLIIELTVNWSVGSLIEVSDIVLLIDNGNLKIMNFETGERNLGSQLFEVIDRSYNIVAGNVKLKLLGGLGFNVDSRFALVSPSSLVASGSTDSLVRLQPSFGQTSVINEIVKWLKFVGLGVQVHSYDWSVIATSTITGVGNLDPAALTLDPPLPFTPAEGYIVDIVPYPTTTDQQQDAQYKLLYTHITPTIAITSGVSDTAFHVSLPDAANLTVGNSVIVRNAGYSVISNPIKIDSVVGTLVTLVSALPFTPDNTYFVEGIGFKDGLGTYLYD